MKRSIKTTLSFIAIAFSLGAIASDDWVKTQTISSHDVKSGAETSAILKNLSPAAIEMGLRDTQMIANVSLEQNNQVMSYKWHSLVKDINGTTYAQALTEPLSSQVKIKGDVSSISAGQELIAKGDIDSMLNDFQLLLAKAEQPTEVDQSSTLNQETNNDDGLNGGGSSGGGFLGGESGDLTENPDTGDVDLELDQIIESVESCSMMVDLNNMIISKQERVIKTSSKTGEVVEVGDCQNVGQAYPIRKDFTASCSTNLDPSTGKYIKGHKLYSYVDGSRYDISECEWDENDAQPYKVELDLNSCDLDLAVLEPESGVYQPAYIEYTTIDGKRQNLSECKNSANVTKPLPVAYEQCDLVNDFENMTSYEQSRKVFKSPDEKEVVKAFDCTNTGNTFEIQRDFEVLQCANYPDYIEKKMLQSFKMYINHNGSKKHISECQFDPDFSVPLMQEVGSCEASVNLTSNLATITKKWYVETQNGGKEYITDCEQTEETYPVVESTAMCTPQYLESQNKVVLQSQKVWVDGSGQTHTVTECRPTSGELEVKKEFCNNPEFEHDFIGGQSYFRSRDYYEKDGQKHYLNDCSRDPSVSLPHTASSSGCPLKHDDNNLRSQLFTKTSINVPGEGDIEIKGCEAQSQYVPYTYLKLISGAQMSSSTYSNVATACRNPSYNPAFGSNSDVAQATALLKKYAHLLSIGSTRPEWSNGYYWLDIEPNISVYQRVDNSEFARGTLKCNGHK